MDSYPSVHPAEELSVSEEHSPLGNPGTNASSSEQVGIVLGHHGSDEEPLRRGGEEQLWCGAR